MTTKSTPLLLHVPGLQPGLAPEGLPGGTLFVSPGLPATDSEAFWRSPELPFSAAEARGCQNEMIALGEQFRNTRDLVTLALQPEAASGRRDADFRHEMAALDRFAESGVVEQGSGVSGAAADGPRESAMAAQKALILAWNLEARVHELHALQSSFSEVAGSFRNVLGVDEEDLEELPGMRNVVAELPEGPDGIARLAWRTVLDAVLRFAPADAVLVTADAGLIGALAEHAEVVPVDADCQPAAEGVRGMCRIAAWTLLGHSRPPVQRPWLDRELRILLADAPQD